MSDRPTPETDSHALKAEDIDEGGNFEAVHANIARRLERQRDELLGALERFARLPGDYNLIMDYGWAIRDAKQIIARVKGGRDE
jgi:hypothetical protein